MPEPQCYMSLGLPVDTPLVNKQGVTNQVLSSCDLGEWQATELLVKVEMLVICKAVFICESHSIWKLKKKPERTNNKPVTYCQVSWANRPIFWDLLGSRCWMPVMRFSCIFRGMGENSSQSIQSVMHYIPPHPSQPEPRDSSCWGVHGRGSTGKFLVCVVLVFSVRTFSVGSSLSEVNC